MAKDNIIDKTSDENIGKESKKKSKKTQKTAKIGSEVTNAGKSSTVSNTRVKTKAIAVKKNDPDQPFVDDNNDDNIDNNEPKTVKGKKKYGNSSLSAVIKTIVYIAVVLAISVGLSIFIILAANDVFALRKSDDSITVELGEYPDINSIADLLYENNVIRFPWLLKSYAKLKKKENYNFVAGTYVVSPSMNYDSLIVAFVPEKAAREQISITIPEGYSVDEIIDLLVSRGIGTRDKFIDVINNGEFNYWFLEELECDEHRIYRLEGYLYPDTYYFWSDSSEWTALNKMLDNFKKKVKKSWKTRCEELGMTFDEVITLASMLQEEARYPTDYPLVSSVFHNRLNSEEFDRLLQSDATIQYFYRNVFGEKKAPFTDDDRKTQTFYNTYLYKGLPPGPLSTPTIDAINSAMYPEQSEYYYFVSDNDGYCIFAKTFEEHKENVLAVENGKSASDETEIMP